MNVVDVIIVLSLAFGAVIGFKRGAIRTGVSFIGLIIAIILATILRHPVANFMLEHFPFFTFGGKFAGVTALNILLYELLAFVIVFAILLIGVGLLNFVSNAIEKALDFTIVLGIPSKILGIVVGFIETYIYVFIILYVLSLPMFNIGIINDSKLTPKILNNTPLLTKYVGTSLDAFQDVYELKDKYNNKDEYNREALNVLLKYKITDVESVERLIDKGKIKEDEALNFESILNNYR